MSLNFTAEGAGVAGGNQPRLEAGSFAVATVNYVSSTSGLRGYQGDLAVVHGHTTLGLNRTGLRRENPRDVIFSDHSTYLAIGGQVDENVKLMIGVGYGELRTNLRSFELAGDRNLPANRKPPLCQAAGLTRPRMPIPRAWD
jgi:hypothetical protein